MDYVNSVNIENKAKEPRVVVTLTTYPRRIDRVHITIESLLRQTVPADMIVLWLAEEQFPGGEVSLPDKLLAQKERGLVIEWCSDIKSYKKIIPAAEKWPEDILITADDDIIYEMNTIERLLESYRKHPTCVSTLRTHLMMFDENGAPLRYVDWKPEYSGLIDRPQMALFPTTGAGTLFPPGMLPKQTFDRDTFMSICPQADDIWIKCMLTLAGVKVVLADVNTKLQYVEGTQSETLYSHNLIGNDEQLRAVLEKYNSIGGEENPEDTLLARMNDLSTYEPKDELCQKYRPGRSFVNEKTGVRVSVILATQNQDKLLRRCLKSVMSQTIQDIEIICVNNASTDDTAEVLEAAAAQDGRIRVITLTEKAAPIAARRKAVLDSKGEYVLFPDVSGILAPDACEQLYSKAENSDADILAFSQGILNPQTGDANPVFSGSTGRLRNKDILLREFAADQTVYDRLTSRIFGGRVCRKAYYHAEIAPAGSDIYDYFLLCRAAEVYVGEESQIYYASVPAKSAGSPEHSSAFRAVAEYIDFAGISEFMPLVEKQRRIMADRDIRAFYSVPRSERANLFKDITSAWNAPETLTSIMEMKEIHGDRFIHEVITMQMPEISRMKIENVGVVVTDLGSARSLFNITEILDCIAVSRKTTLIGATKSNTANTVLSAKTNYAGAELNEEECADTYTFAARFDKVLTEENVDGLVLWAGDSRFAQLILHARLRGIPVVVAMTEPVYSPMMDCSLSSASLSALRLAAITATDSPAQQRLLDTMGLPVRYIPRPALRTMGGRTNGRLSANAIIWAGIPDDPRSNMEDALDIFAVVRKTHPEIRMLMYVDGVDDVEALGETMPEGVTLRRMRPDYGIFSDAVIHLVTGTAGAVSNALRAGRTLGIPAVMYRFEDEQDSGAGAVTVHPGDKASAAAEVIRLLEDKKRREHLGAQAKISTGAADREETARRWSEVLDDAPSFAARPLRLPEDELGRTLSAALAAYESGAEYNAARLAEYEKRCEAYEQMLLQAEERRVKETGALNTVIDNVRAQLRDKERACADAAAQLEDIRTSTSYKAGSALTFIPRYIKKLIRRLTGGEE